MARFTNKVTSPTNPADRHQLKIARGTVRYGCAMLGVVGGPNHYEAAAIIHRLTGVFVNIDADCTCRKPAA